MQLAKFGLVGATATLIYAAVFSGAVEIFSIPPVIAVFIGFSLAVLVSFYGHRHLTFRAQGQPGQFSKFVVVALTSLFANVLITYLVVNVFSLWYGYAIAASVVLVPGMTFLLSKIWVFAPKR